MLYITLIIDKVRYRYQLYTLVIYNIDKSDLIWNWINKNLYTCMSYVCLVIDGTKNDQFLYK